MKPETKVGIMVSAALFILMIGIFFVGNLNLNSRGYKLGVTFSFVNNLKPDARVLYAGGVMIGRVQSIVPDGDLVRVVMTINRGVQIRRDAEITIYSQGLLGEKYVEVNTNPDQEQGGFLGDNEVVRGLDPISSDATMMTLHHIAETLKEVIGDPEMKDALIRTVKNAGRITESLNKIVVDNSENVRLTLKNFRSSSESLETLARSLQGLINNLTDLTNAKNKEAIQTAISNLAKTSGELDHTMTTLSSMADKIDKGEGTLGALVSDKEMARDLRSMVQDLHEAVEEIKKDPSRLIWKKNNP